MCTNARNLTIICYMSLEDWYYLALKWICQWRHRLYVCVSALEFQQFYITIKLINEMVRDIMLKEVYIALKNDSVTAPFSARFSPVWCKGAYICPQNIFYRCNISIMHSIVYGKISRVCYIHRPERRIRKIR